MLCNYTNFIPLCTIARVLADSRAVENMHPTAFRNEKGITTTTTSRGDKRDRNIHMPADGPASLPAENPSYQTVKLSTQPRLRRERYRDQVAVLRDEV